MFRLSERRGYMRKIEGHVVIEYPPCLDKRAKKFRSGLTAEMSYGDDGTGRTGKHIADISQIGRINPGYPAEERGERSYTILRHIFVRKRSDFEVCRAQVAFVKRCTKMSQLGSSDAGQESGQSEFFEHPVSVRRPGKRVISTSANGGSRRRCLSGVRAGFEMPFQQ